MVPWMLLGFIATLCGFVALYLWVGLLPAVLIALGFWIQVGAALYLDASTPPE